MRWAVCCVLKTGGVFTEEWVFRLQRGVRRYLPLEHDFVCFTDADTSRWPADINVIPLRLGLPGWWSKFEMYDDWPFNIMYYDLDTLFTGLLTDIAAFNGTRAVLTDFIKTHSMIGSGMMLWRAGAMRSVWEAFRRDPATAMERHRRRSDFFLFEHMEPAERIQNLWPGQVISKRDCHGRIPRGARVVCMHGEPRLSEMPEAHFLRRAWEAQ